VLVYDYPVYRRSELLHCVIFWLWSNFSKEHTASIISPDDGGSMFLWNIVTQPKLFTVQRLRSSVFTSPWKHKIYDFLFFLPPDIRIWNSFVPLIIVHRAILSFTNGIFPYLEWSVHDRNTGLVTLKTKSILQSISWPAYNLIAKYIDPSTQDKLVKYEGC
jgi:hypothetical protein